MAPRPARTTALDRRARILELAESLFARSGFHHVSMDDIADLVDVSKPVLYRYFPSKLDLYLAVVDHRGDALVEAVDAELATVRPGIDSGRDLIRAVVAAFVQFAERAGSTASLLFSSDVTRDSEVLTHVERATRRTAEAVARVLASSTDLGPTQTALLADVLVGVARSVATSAHRMGLPDDDAVDLVTRFAWDGVRSLLADPAT